LKHALQGARAVDRVIALISQPLVAAGKRGGNRCKYTKATKDRGRKRGHATHVAAGVVEAEVDAALRQHPVHV